jgi:hypothetical protein
VSYSGSNDFDPIATVFFIGIVVFIGIIICHFKKKADEARKVRNEAFARGVKLADPNRIDRANDGCPVYVKGGQLQVDGPPADPIFQMPTKNEAFLRRKVEVYCWKEQLSSIEERHGNQVRRGTKCDYTPHWSESVPDSSRFRDKAKQNIKSNIPSQDFWAD